MAEPRVFLKENRGRIEENYLEQAKNLPRVFAPVDEKLQKCTEEVALACKYLYAFMPYSDIGNYPFEVFLDYAENGKRNSDDGCKKPPAIIEIGIKATPIILSQFT